MIAFAALIALGATAPEIPSEFQGRWGLEPADCAAPAADAPSPDGLAVVRGDGVDLFASSARLLDLLARDDGFAFVALVHNEGEEHPIRERIVLRRGGATLIIRLGDDTLTYVRCADAAPATLGRR